MSDQQGGPGPWGTPDDGPIARGPGRFGPSSPYGPPGEYPTAAPSGTPTAYGLPAEYLTTFGPQPLPPGVEYASWGSRGVALIIDYLLMLVCLVPGLVVTVVAASQATPGQNPSAALSLALVVLFVGGIFLWLYQYTWMQGVSGQSWGKQLLGIHLLRETDLQPPGGGTGVARYALRTILGDLTCGIYTVVTLLWPLWDAKCQTLDDKMVHTLVLRLPR